MKFLLDESAEFRLAAFLQAQGHDVTAIAHDYPASLADRDVLAIARREGRILITNDRDFGELIVRHRLEHAGVIFFRLGSASTIAEKSTWPKRLLVSHKDHLNQFLVVTPRGVRLRRT